MNETYAKWNMSDREKQIMYDVIEMWILKKKKKTHLKEERRLMFIKNR